MRLRTGLARISWILVALATWFAALPTALAGPGGQLEARAGAIVLEPASGSGSVELVGRGDGESYRGTFHIRNRGHGPLEVTRIYPRHSAEQPRVPGTLTATADGSLPRTVGPGDRLAVQVEWVSRSMTVRELYGHILVDSDAVASTGHEPAFPAAIGVHAERPSGLGFVGRHLLSWIVFLPLLGALAILLLPLVGYRKDESLRRLTIVLMGIELLLAGWLCWRFEPSFVKAHGNDGLQLIERAVWLRPLGVEYFVGVDGLSVTMVLLTAIVAFVGAIVSFGVRKQLGRYLAMYCLLVTAMMGTFVALDLALFLLFWLAVLVPSYVLVGISGRARSRRAATKLLVYLLAGSAPLLLALLYVYLRAEPAYLVDGHAVSRSLSLPELARVRWDRGESLFGMSTVVLLWSAMFAAFAVRIQVFPLHRWLSDAIAEAPTAVSVLLAAVLVKTGLYGILRFNVMLLPEATRSMALVMALLGVISIVYGALRAMAQSDLKRFVAYASMSHLGFCLLGFGAMTPQGIEGGLMQMFSHGLIVAMLLLLVGVLSTRARSREIDRFGGLAKQMPVYAALCAFALLASLGLPGLSGFWGELLTVVGAFPRYRLLAIVAMAGAVLSAAYHLRVFERVFLGSFRESWLKSKALQRFGGSFPEIDRREIVSVAPLALLVLLLGLWPRPLLGLVDRASLELHRLLDAPGSGQIGQRALERRGRIALDPSGAARWGAGD